MENAKQVAHRALASSSLNGIAHIEMQWPLHWNSMPRDNDGSVCLGYRFQAIIIEPHSAGRSAAARRHFSRRYGHILVHRLPWTVGVRHGGILL